MRKLNVPRGTEDEGEERNKQKKKKEAEVGKIEGEGGCGGLKREKMERGRGEEKGVKKKERRDRKVEQRQELLKKNQ